MTREKISQILDSAGFKPIAYQPLYVSVTGSVNAALLLSQLVYWSDKGRHPEGWIYKTANDLTLETGLTREAQRTARKLLLEKGLIEESDTRMLNIDKFKTTKGFRVVFLTVCEEVSRLSSSRNKNEKRAPSKPNTGMDVLNPEPKNSQSGRMEVVRPIAENTPATTPQNSSIKAAANFPESKKHGSQKIVCGVEVWTPLDLIGVDALVAKYGPDRVKAIASTTQPFPGHGAPYFSQVHKAFNAIELAAEEARAKERDNAKKRAEAAAVDQRHKDKLLKLEEVISQGESARSDLVKSVMALKSMRNRYVSELNKFKTNGRIPEPGMLLGVLLNAVDARP